MISSATNETEVKQAEAAPQFTAGPPQLNPLAANSPIAVTIRANGISLDLVDDLFHADLVRGSGTITDRMIARSEREVTRRPNSARAHTNLGIALLNAGDVESAQKEFETALSTDPKHYVASMNLARIRTEQKRLEDAENIYAELASNHPKDPALVLSLAHIAIRREQYDNAVKLLRKAIELGHKAITAKHLLGLLLLRMGKNREAISTLRSATHLQVREPKLYEALGVAYAVAGEHRRAALAFKTVLSLNPWSANAVRGLARALLSLKNADDATELLVTYLERNPQDDEAKRLLAEAYAIRRQYRAAAAQLIQVWGVLEELKSNDTLLKIELANNIGVNYFNNRDVQQAEQWFSRAIVTGPNCSPLPYANLARVYLYNRLVPRAFEVLSQARSRFGNDASVVSLMAACLSDVGSYHEAVALIRPIYETGKATPEIYAQLSSLLSEGVHDVESALKVGEEAYRKFPENGVVANNLAYLYLTVGNAQAARPILEKHANGDHQEYNPVNEVCLTATWGLLNIVEGNLGEGARLYKKAEKLAAQYGNKQLQNTAIQKMHLELARAYARRQEYLSAKEHVQKGLAINDGRLTYQQQLEKLQRDLATRSEGSQLQ